MPVDQLRLSLCDDDRSFRTLVRAVIEAQDDMRVVSESCDGHDCLKEVAEVKPDVVLLDLDMPTMTGLQALDKLRAVCPAAKVIVLSGQAREQVERVVRDLGATAFIDKGAAQLVSSLAGHIRSAVSATA
jgi:DNA-binding NarL/FixJ family response regulator